MHEKTVGSTSPMGSLVNGKLLEGGKFFSVVDKYDGKLIGTVAEATRVHVRAAVSAARATFEAGGGLDPRARAVILRRAADLLRERRTLVADVMVAETGFTPDDVEGDITRTIVTLSLSSEEATRILGETVAFAASPGQHERIGFTIRVPLGVVCAITPFNSPLNTVAHKVAPALAAGNAVILKPSGLTPITAELFCRILLDAGLPPGFISLLHGLDGKVGSWLMEEQDIDFYSFTGSTRVGRLIQQLAGLRPTQLELGSIASVIVCADADLDRAVPKIAKAAFRKAGQVCTSVQRVFVERSVFDELVGRLGQEARQMQAGDPRDPTINIGPMISEAAAHRAGDMIDEAIANGARAIAGAERAGAVLQPTVITGATQGLRILTEEIFAPVVSLQPFDVMEEALARANDTQFGLSAGIFTGDVTKAVAAARKLRFGSVHINETSSARADGMPFGGVKDSGHGLEGPRFAIRELTSERLVTLNA